MSMQTSQAERRFLEDGIAQGLRNDGRGRLDCRPITVETGVIPQANGSARVKIGETDLLVGVKLELGQPEINRPEYGVVKIAVDCSPSVSPEFGGRGADELNTELARVLERVLSNPAAVDLKGLCVIPGKSCWIVYVDILILDSGGNLLDAAALGSRAALYNTTIPKITIIDTESGDKEIELDDDPDSALRFNMENIPLCVTLSKIGARHIFDPTVEEELCTSARLTVAVSRKGKILGVQKSGDGAIDVSALPELLQSARKIGLHMLQVLEATLENEQRAPPGLKRPKLGFFA